MQIPSKRLVFMIVSIIITMLVGFGAYFKLIYKTPEEKALNLVMATFDGTKNSKDISNLLSENFRNTVSANKQTYAISDDTFFIQNELVKDANIIVIGRKGKLTTGQEQIQYFSVKKTGDEYKIDDSIGYVFFANTGYSFTEDAQGKTDNQIANMIQAVQEGLKMEIVDIKHPSYSPEWIIGTVKVENKSDYDIQNVNLVVYNYDKNGVSVSPDILFIGSIQKHGRAEASWTSMHCSECVSHKVELKP